MHISIPTNKLRTSSLSREQAAASTGSAPGSPYCAYPSWPRRSSLSGRSEPMPANSFLSDDELFPDVFEEESSEDCTPITSAVGSPRTGRGEADMISGSMLRQILSMHEEVKEVKVSSKPAKKQKRRKSSTSKKPRSSSVARTMQVIQEDAE